MEQQNYSTTVDKSSKKPGFKKFYKTVSLKNGNSDSKYNFEIFKTKIKLKRPPKVPKNQKHTEGGLKSKSCIKQTLPKVGILIQNTISKFQKPKIKLKKDPLRFIKFKNIYKEASNQKVL